MLVKKITEEGRGLGLYKLVWGLNTTEKKTNSQRDSLPSRQDRTGNIPGNTWSEGGLRWKPAGGLVQDRQWPC